MTTTSAPGGDGEVGAKFSAPTLPSEEVAIVRWVRLWQTAVSSGSFAAISPRSRDACSSGPKTAGKLPAAVEVDGR
jgi:hypothetical protein